MKLQKVKEALEGIRRVNFREKDRDLIHIDIEDITKEALTELNEFMERLESEELVDLASKAVVSWALQECQPSGEHFGFIDDNAENIAQAAINVIKEMKR